MKKQTWIQFLIAGWVGGCLVYCGFPYNTHQFWMAEIPLVIGLVYLGEE